MIWWPSALALCAVRWVGLRPVGRLVKARRADGPWCCEASLTQSGRGQESVSHAAVSSLFSGIFVVLWTIQIARILGTLNRLSSKCQNTGATLGAWRGACQCWGRAVGRDLACIAHPTTQKGAWCTTLVSTQSVQDAVDEVAARGRFQPWNRRQTSETDYLLFAHNLARPPARRSHHWKVHAREYGGLPPGRRRRPGRRPWLILWRQMALPPRARPTRPRLRATKLGHGWLPVLEAKRIRRLANLRHTA